MSTEVEAVLEGLCAEANGNVETRLRLIHKTIKGFKKNNVDLTAPNLVNALAALGITISKSSIYNKKVRGKDNPYRVLVDAWNKAIDDSKMRTVESSVNTNFTVMSNADYESISSDVVKFKIQNMYNELRAARHQINLLKDIQTLPLVEEKGDDLLLHKGGKSIAAPSSSSSDEVIPATAEQHMQVIEDFIGGSSKLAFDEEGCLVALKGIRKGDVLSDLELKQALAAAINIMKNSRS
jgi:hypothetical protein